MSETSTDLQTSGSENITSEVAKPKEPTEREIQMATQTQLASMKAQIAFLKVRKELASVQTDIAVLNFTKADAEFKHLQIISALREMPNPNLPVPTPAAETTPEAQEAKVTTETA